MKISPTLKGLILRNHQVASWYLSGQESPSDVLKSIDDMDLEYDFEGDEAEMQEWLAGLEELLRNRGRYNPTRFN